MPYDSTCQNCKHREQPDGHRPLRGWCSKSNSDYFDKYVYKGDTCNRFSLLPALKSKEEKSAE